MRFKTNTWKEILQQPLCWQLTQELVAKKRGELDAFLAPILRQKELRVIITGAGSSAFAGDLVALELALKLDIDIKAIATTDIVASPTLYLDATRPLLLISLARSGNSPESLAAFELAEQIVPNFYQLIISCNEGGQLHKAAQKAAQGRALSLLMPSQTHDLGFAMTSSFSSMALALLCVFLPQTSTKAMCERAKALLEDYAPSQPALLPESQMPFFSCKRVVYLASNKALAQEAALKILELSAGKLVSLYETYLGFRHGPKSIMDDETFVLCFRSQDSHTRKYEADLIEEIRRDREGAASKLKFGDPSNFGCCEVPAYEGLEGAQLALVQLIAAQVFALQMSVDLGLNPDEPNAAGIVNRVVKGVSIHPFEG